MEPRLEELLLGFSRAKSHGSDMSWSPDGPFTSSRFLAVSPQNYYFYHVNILPSQRRFERNGGLTNPALKDGACARQEGQRYLDTLVAKSGVDPSLIEPLNTIYSARRRLSDGDVVPLELDIYKFQGPKSTVYLAYGDLGNKKRWYLRSPCTKPQCGDAGFIQLHQTEKWSPKRSSMFRKSIEEATTKANKVECPMHRTPLGS